MSHDSKRFMGDPRDRSGSSAVPLLLSDPSAPIRLVPRTLLKKRKGMGVLESPARNVKRAKSQITPLITSDDEEESGDTDTLSE